MKQLLTRWLTTRRKNDTPRPPAASAGNTALYPAVRHPFPGRSFADITPAEAQSFLDWHVAHLPERIRIAAAGCVLGKLGPTRIG